jgi:pSer/pThr/pTyr-binding forkhead associated (FHA) protein
MIQAARDAPARGGKMGGNPEARGVLVICNGGFEGMEYALTADETLIGRNPTTDITLLDENISREHAIVLLDEETGSYTIEDLQSSNGTKVNGKRIRSAELADTDEIEIGSTRFRFLLRNGSSAAS